MSKQPKCNIKYYYLSGVGSIQNVRGSSQELQDMYTRAFNNRKDRVIVFNGTNGVDFLVNLDNISVMEIVEIDD